MRPGWIEGEKPLYWVASAKKDLLEMPQSVRRKIGMALARAQYGGKDQNVKSWQGLGSGIYEIVSDFDGDTFRGVYAVRFKKAVYALHFFKKKSPSGIKTAKSDVDLIEKRLQAARADYEARHAKKEK